MRIQFILAATIVCAVAADRSDAKRIPIDAVTLIFNGQPATGRPVEPELATIYDATVPTLRNKGFIILPTSNKQNLIGGATLADVRIGILLVDLRPPGFTFNVVIVPQWNKTKAGEIVLTSELGGELWKADLRVPVALAEGKQRHDRAIELVPEKLRDLSPAARPKTRSETPANLVLRLNAIDLDAVRFVDLARGLLATKDPQFATAFIDLAADPRLAELPELRINLVRTAVVSGASGLEPAIGRVLAREMMATDADHALTELLLEGLALLGASPGEVLAPYVGGLGLNDLLALRERFPLQTEARVMDSRIEELGVAAIEASASFADAERLLRRLPLARLTLENRLRMRGALFAHTTRANLAELYPRINRLFPDSEYPPPEVDHLEEEFVSATTDLIGAPIERRLAYLADYKKYSPSGRSVDRMVALLALENELETRLTTGLAEATTADTERAALHDVFGRHIGPRGLATFGRALVRALGKTPRESDVLALLARQPDVPEVGQRARELGLIRGPVNHAFPVALGANITSVTVALGNGRRIEALRRQDLSPGGVVSARSKVPRSDRRGFLVIDYEKQHRILLKDGVVFRIIIDDSKGRYHHGVRTGDPRTTLLATLGEPTEQRALMFGRELLTWNNVDGDHHLLTAVLDDGVTSLLYEDDPAVTRTSLAALW